MIDGTVLMCLSYGTPKKHRHSQYGKFLSISKILFKQETTLGPGFQVICLHQNKHGVCLNENLLNFFREQKNAISFNLAKLGLKTILRIESYSRSLK